MSQERYAEMLMVLIAILESLFPIISVFSIVLIGSITSFAFIIAIATFIFTLLLLYKKQFQSLFHPLAQKDLLLTSFLITVLFLLVFISLHFTTAGNVAVLLFLQLFFSYLYFNLFGREKISALHTLGAALMGFGAVVLLFPHEWHFNIGDILALCAAAVAPMANYYQKRARQYVGSITILTYRNIVALPVVFFLAFFLESTPEYDAFLQALPYIFFNAVFIYVLAKILWIEALHRISITKMNAMLALSPVFTIILAKIFLNEAIEVEKIIGVFPIIIGGYLITKKPKPLLGAV